MAKSTKVDYSSMTELINLIGGKDNITIVTHCMTRLRFALVNNVHADVESIKRLSFVKGCFTNAGQFQVIIGTDVKEYYHALINQLAIDNDTKQQADPATNNKTNQPLWEKCIAHLAEIFVPLLPALISGGLLLGIRNLLGEIPFISNEPLIYTYPRLVPFYDVLWLPCEAIFHFLPVAICWSTVKKMGGSEILGIVLGITLVSPQLMNAYLIGSQVPPIWDFGWFTVDKIGYQAQVIPSILAGFCLGWLEKNLQKITPDYLNLIVVPITALLLAVLLSHIVLGPIGRITGDYIANIVKFLMTGAFAPIGSAIVGFFYSALVITGIHHTTLAIDLQMTSNMGGTPLWPIIALSNIAQASAVVGIILVNNKSTERKIAIPAAISGYLGVTEPAMYGVNLRYRFPMLCAMIGSAFSGLTCGLYGVLSNGIGVGGLPSVLSIKPFYWSVYLIAIMFAVIIPMVLTVLVYQAKQRKGTLTVN